jgi:tryptophan-rich sensory protein
VTGDALKQRWMVVAHAHTYVPAAFVVIVVFWFSVLFAVFTMLAPGNATATTFMIFCTVAVAGGVFLVQDMSQPFDGLIHISREPMETALGMLGR